MTEITKPTDSVPVTNPEQVLEGGGVISPIPQLTPMQASIRAFAWAFFGVFAVLIAGCIVYICMRLPTKPPLDAPLESIDRYKDLCQSSIEDCGNLVKEIVEPVLALITLCLGFIAGKYARRDE